MKSDFFNRKRLNNKKNGYNWNKIKVYGQIQGIEGNIISHD